MYSKDNVLWRRDFIPRRWNEVATAILARANARGRWKSRVALVIAAVTFAAVRPGRGAALMEEGFNYPVGSNLAADSPWTGAANSALSIGAGNLSTTTLRGIVPAGNLLQLTGAATASARRTFSATAIGGNAVYCSFLINWTGSPTNQQFIAALLRGGATSASPPDDPLDVYVYANGGGYSFTMTSVGSDPASSGKVLAFGTTHLVVIKYTFTTFGLGQMYIDPPTGGVEPANADITTASDDNVGPTSLQVLLFRSTAGSSVFNVDTVRVGTNWPDVTPLGGILNLTGPQNQAVCSGSAATFNISADGTPPYFYQWRTNGVPVPNATNNSFLLPAPTATDSSNIYDVVVQDSFNTATSQVARLTISTVAAGIKIQPASPIVMPSTTNATFTVSAGGDAPLSFQWRTNGIPIGGATNSSYTVVNAASADPSVQYDVVVSNPCGTVTSSPPALLLFPSVFYVAYDAGPGFFSGENLVVTNAGGLALQAWSSVSLSNPITSWNLEGPLQEQPLNDGSGKSVYSINVNPAASPQYYIFGNKTSAPYLPPIPILAITLDPSGFYILADSQMGISANGVLGTPGPQLSAAPRLTGGLDFSGVGQPGGTYLLQTCTNFPNPNSWVTLQTNVADGSGVVRFTETNLPATLRFYRLLGQ